MDAAADSIGLADWPSSETSCPARLGEALVRPLPPAHSPGQAALGDPVTLCLRERLRRRCERRMEPSLNSNIDEMPAAFCPHMAGHLFMTSALRGASFLDDARRCA